MKPIDVIREVKLKANGQWQKILSNLGAEVPLNTHTACPACGGKDRFRFDNKGDNGTFICNQCGSGDGLDLVQRVLGGSVTEAAYEVAGMIGIDTRSDNPPAYRSHEVKAQQDALKAQQAENLANEQIEKHKRFTERYSRTIANAKRGESEYLKAKGFDSTTVTLLADGSLIIPLIDTDGTITAAQTIKPNGEKRLLLDSTKNGSYCPINEPVNVSTVIIAEGLATAMTCQLIQPEAHTVAAIDAGNLIHVAKVMRTKYPESQIIIAGDNDIKPDQSNTGKLAAEKAAKAVNGITVLPSTDDKADWDDYRLSHGIEAARQAFNEALDQQGGKAVSVTNNLNGANKKTKRKHDKGNNPTLSQMAASQKSELLAERYGLVAVESQSGDIIVFNGDIWVRETNDNLKRTLTGIYIDNDTPFNPKGFDAVIDALKLQSPRAEKQRRDLIGFKNGVYDLKTNKFHPHSPDYWLMNHNDIVFTQPVIGENLKDDAPNYYKWINHAAEGNQQKVSRINAALFMVLANRYDWQLFIEVTGEGGSGKSVFSSIATLLAGEHNTASGSAQTLESARGRAQFVGKSLITLPDQKRYIGDGSGIKAITGGDPIEIDGKYEKQFTTVIKSVVLATNNEPMAFTERNGGIARRRVIFPFNAVVKDSDKDPNLMDKIRKEIAVVIRHLIKEFADQDMAKLLLIEQRDSIEAMDVKRHADPLYGFCAHIVALGEAVGMLMGNKNINPRAPRIYLYHAYLTYLEAYGFERPLTLTSFGKDFPKVMKEYGAEYLKAKTKIGVRYNMELAESAEDWLPAVPNRE